MFISLHLRERTWKVARQLQMQAVFGSYPSRAQSVFLGAIARCKILAAVFHRISLAFRESAAPDLRARTLSLVAVISFIMCGCDSGTGVTEVLEIKCKINSGLDQKKRCLEVDRPGAIMDVRVNSTTQAVQIVIIKNDGNWLDQSFILKSCNVVNTSNWECAQSSFGKRGSIAEGVEFILVWGMFDGRLYRKFEGTPPNFYSSSISGWKYWAYKNSLIDLQAAIGPQP
jgi:hypothetical protein